jgi:monoamine oxidase
VVIAGAGLAGLCAAYELRKRGYQVIVLEAQARPGGRVRTLREEFAPGVLAEAGATRIPDHHDLTMRYIREFGLGVVPFEAPDLRKTLHVAGQNFAPAAGEKVGWPLPLTEDERKSGLDELTRRYLLEPILKLQSKSRDRSVPQELKAYDGLTMKQFFARQGLSPAAAKLVFLGYPDQTGSAAWILNLAESLTSCRRVYRIRGGNDRLPFSFAARLADTVRYGCPLMSIGQSDSEAWAVVDRNGTREVVRGDFLVCTLPFSTLKGMLADARLSRRKSEAIQKQKYIEATKIFLQMRRQFWVDRKLSGFADTDLESERFWALGDYNASHRGLLLAYTVGPGAAKIDNKSDIDRIKTALRDAEAIFPGAMAEYEGGCTKSWTLDPWQNGAMAKYDPGELGNIEVNATREGRIHFAGEHTSRWNGWMQGALESAHRVAQEIGGLTIT